MANFVIPSGGTTSNRLQLTDIDGIGDTRLSGLVMPAGWDAADLTFQVDYGDNNYRDVWKHNGTDAAAQLKILSAEIVANRAYGFDGALALMGASARALRLVSSATQNADRTFIPMLIAN